MNQPATHPKKMEDVVFAALAILSAVAFFRWRLSPLYDIPTLGGPSLPFFSYFSALNVLVRGKTIVTEGYKKYFGTPFKIPFLTGWVVVVSSPEAIEDIRSRPPSELSLSGGFEDVFPSGYCINHPEWDEHWEVEIIRGRLTRSIGAVIPNVADEQPVALSATIPASDGACILSEGALSTFAKSWDPIVLTTEWVTLPAMQTAEKLVVRSAGRGFVGLPTCRDSEYLDLIVQFTHRIANFWPVSLFFPYISGPPLKLAPYLSGVDTTIGKLIRKLKPVIQKRRSKFQESSGKWEDAPDDLLQWCIEEAMAKGYSDDSVVLRILSINFAALHTSTLSLTHALYDLATYPENLHPLREEIEEVVASEGWTKNGLNKMRKLDSFLKESHRWNGLTFLSVFRKAMTDITLRDGTKIPQGAYIAAPATAVHHDESKYMSNDVFDPFRFARLREQDEHHGVSHQFSNTSPEWLAFGHGRNACPGRFFAASVLKLILANLVLNFDIKLVEEGKRPANFFFFMAVAPNLSGKVMFRKRQVDREA
ncbi:cytochrome P450 [Fomes fomentarius]|nr:cytochrome P450 [Fomes fomentarius]